MWERYLQIVITLTVYGIHVYGDCSFESVAGQEPIVLRNLGFQKILASKSSQIYMEVGENMDIYCVTGIRIGNHYNNYQIKATQLKLQCRESNDLFYATSEMEEYINLQSPYIYCNSASGIQLYESNIKMPNCEPYTSLGLGIQVTNLTSVIYAGVCYDWITLDLKYVNYQAYMDQNIVLPTNLKDIEYIDKKQVDEKSISLDKPLRKYNSFFNFISEDQFDVHYKDLQGQNILLEHFNFNYGSLVQDLPLNRELENYNNILSTIWWSNLRLGNWRTFINLLHARSEVQKYNVYIGSSGVIEIPSTGSTCNTNETFVIVTKDGLRKSAPEYIWSYVKAIHPSDTEEFVVIGYNSPFYNSGDSKEICQDMCNEIPWLLPFAKVRRMPTLGLVYCCHPSEVADKLDNFPFNLEKKSVPDENAFLMQETATQETSQSTEPTLANLILNDFN